MARIRPTWTPGSAGGYDYTYGFVWSADESVSAGGLWWYQHATGPAAVTAKLYLESSQTLLTSSPSTGGLVAGTWNYIPFTTTYSCTAAVIYTAAVHALGSAAYDSGQLNSPIVSPDGHVTIPASGGRYQAGEAYPAATWTGMHGVDLEYSISAATPVPLVITVSDHYPACACAYLSRNAISVPGVSLATPAPIVVTIQVDRHPAYTYLSRNAPRAMILRPNSGIITRPNTGMILQP